MLATVSLDPGLHKYLIPSTRNRGDALHSAQIGKSKNNTSYLILLTC